MTRPRIAWAAPLRNDLSTPTEGRYHHMGGCPNRAGPVSKTPPGTAEKLKAENTRLRAVIAECLAVATHSQGGNEVDGIRAIISRLVKD